MGCPGCLQYFKVPPWFPAGAIPGGKWQPLCRLGHFLLSMVLIAPYPETLPLTCLQETLH